MQNRRILRSDDTMIMRSGKRRILSSSSEVKKRRKIDLRGPVWDENSGERILGVSTSRSGARYEARIRIKKKLLFLGSYDTIQEASDVYNAKKRELDQAAARGRVKDSDHRAEIDVLDVDQFQTQTSPDDDKSPRDLRKEIVSVKNSNYNGGGAIGFMIPDSGAGRKVFLPVIDNHGFLVGKFSEGDVSILDDWLFKQTSPESRDSMNETEGQTMQTEIEEAEVFETESSHVLTSETDVPTQIIRNEAEVDSPEPAKKKKKVGLESSRRSCATTPTPPSATDALSSTFYDEDCQSIWETKIRQKKILSERPSDLEAYEECGFTDYLNYLGFTTAATVYDEYNKDVVEEFYSNLNQGNLDPNSEWYEHVYIRGKVVRFSGESINRLLGLPTPEDFNTVISEDFEVTDDEMLSEITGGFQCEWPAQKNAAASSLTSRYFCLYQVAIHSWIPSSNITAVTRLMAKLLYCIGTKTRMNLGLMIQESIVSQAISSRESNCLSYPCIISALMREENVEVKESDAVVSTVPVKPNKRTFSMRMVKDLPWTTSSASAERVKEAKILAIEAKLTALRLQIDALEAEKAKLIQIGRPVLFSLASEGEAGVRKVLRDEFELTMQSIS